MTIRTSALGFRYLPGFSVLVVIELDDGWGSEETALLLDDIAHVYGEAHPPHPPPVGQLRARLCDDGSCQHRHAGRVCLVCTHPAHAAATRLRMAVPPGSAP